MEFWVFLLLVWVVAESILRVRYQKQNNERFGRIITALNRFESDVKRISGRLVELERHAATPAAGPPPIPGVGVPAPSGRETNASPAPTPRPTVPIGPVGEPIPAAPPFVGSNLPAPPRVPSTAPVPPPITPHETAGPSQPIQPTAARPSPPSQAGPSSVSPRARVLSSPPKRRSASDIEEQLGTNWLNKIGITVLVIGVSLFLAYKFPSLTNPEKVGLGYLVSLAILGTGMYLEGKDRYRIFARALIGGGWALTFFTTYAMHFVKYTQVVETQWVDLVLMFIVAAIMVGHTLRYNSQVVTGLAFLLGFTTVAISQNTVYCLSAGAILAIGLVTIVYRRRWFELEVFGLLASYLNHYIWLRSVIEPMSGQKQVFPEFVPSAVLLCLYWAIYRWSYIARRIQNQGQEHVSTFAALLNTSFLLLLLRYQSVRADLAFYVLLILGAAELTLGQLPVTRRRRDAFVVLSTIGATLLVAAIPFKFSGMDVAIIWLAQAQALFLAGVFTREALFRRFGLLAALLTAGDMIVSQAEPILTSRLETGVSISEFHLAVTFFVAALLFYVNSLGTPRRWKELIESEFEETCFRALSYIAGLMLFTSVWLAFTGAWTAVAWAAAALAASLLGRAWVAEDLSHQAHIFAFAAFAWALDVNRTATGHFMSTGVTLRLVTLSLLIVLFYQLARWAGQAKTSSTQSISEMYTTGAAILAVVLAYYECHWAWTGIAWTGFGLALAILGLILSRRDLSYQAHLLALAGFVRTLVVNIDATRQYYHMTLRFITFAAMAVLLYLNAYFSGPRESKAARVFSMVHAWAGSILLSVLAYKEFSSSWIAVAWATFALLLLIAGDRLERMELHFQAYLLSMASLVRALTVNLYASEAFPPHYPRITLRLVTVALTSALLYASSWWAAKGRFDAARFAGAAYTWAGSLLITLLLWYELSSLNVALGWVLFGLVLFEFGFLRKSFSWRLQAYVVFCLSFARVFLVNVDAQRTDLVVPTLPLALAFYYVYWRMLDKKFDFLEVDRKMQAPAILCYFGSATLATILCFWLDAGWVAAGWAGLALFLIAVAWAARRDVFLGQSYLLSGAVLLRTVFFHLLSENQWGQTWLDSRWFRIGTAAALLFMALAFAFPLRERYTEESRRRPNARSMLLALERPEQVFFFVPLIIVTILVGKEVSQGRVTMAWGIEAVLVFLFALLVGERSFRLTGLSLLLLCVGKILVLDVWRQDRSDRYVTFIILGVASLLVSFLYTRYSEAINRYL
jgi:uncharacterized membrane protein